MNLVLIETSGNQQYIFATNKLRENVGASELTYRVGTEWVLKAVERNDGPDLWNEDAEQLRRNLLSQSGKPRQGGIEVILATSGKAMLLVETSELGKKIVRDVTCRALKYTPGIDVCGVVSAPFDWEKRWLGDVVRETHQRLDQVRDRRLGAALRFLRLPVAMDCATSGLPAAEWDERKEGEEPSAARSAVSLKKRRGRESYGPRMKKLLRLDQSAGDFAENIGVLEKYCDWLAVVHADGNGLGQVFLDFWQNSGCAARVASGEAIKDVNQVYATLYRKFSIALDICTEEAFICALEKLQTWKDKLRSLRRIRGNRDDVLPLLPIVLGGDDLTVVCDGQAALQFTHKFLTEFERQTARKDLPLDLQDIVPKIAAASPSVRADHLSACAGVAIVKPHFPFSSAYDLSEQLLKSAKQMKPHSALDFHALYDASGSDLDLIREKLCVDQENPEKTLLYGRPYALAPQVWQALEKRVEAIFKKDDDGRRRLPNSQLHDLRNGLFMGRENADARYQLIRPRYEAQGIAVFDETDEDGRKHLFFPDTIKDEHGNPQTVQRTRLLDALDAANFWVEDD